jgi:dCTP deaminase
MGFSAHCDVMQSFMVRKSLNEIDCTVLTELLMPEGLHGRLGGVLNDDLLREAVSKEYISAGEYRIDESRIQPASLDLTLGERAHRLRSSFLPNRERVEPKLKELSQGTIDLREGNFLEYQVPYLIELREQLNLPDYLRAKANPKSSTGRLDIFTRVITDHGPQFDEIRPGYRGKLYLEVVPISFPIKVKEGFSLNQLRLTAGTSQTLSDDEIRKKHDQYTVLRVGDRPVSQADLALSNGLFLSLDLHGGADGIVGYKAKSYTRLLDLTGPIPLNVTDFWEPVVRERGDRIVLEPESFYLLLSRERVSIPPELASEMVAYDPTSGELRTHYAGFFDPGFGWGNDVPGSRAALEVRAHDVPFMIEDGQAVCKLSFEKMARKPTRLYGGSSASHYQGQETTLSKFFLQPRQLTLDDLANAR